MKQTKIILFIGLLLTLTQANAQHYLGVKNGYGIMGLSATPSIRAESTTSIFNPGIIYRFEHKTTTRVQAAIQGELNYITKGYWANDTTHVINSIELPLLSQGYIRFGRFRPYITGGAFLGWITNRKIEVNNVRKEYKADEHDNHLEYGILIGGGLGFLILNNLELQTEWRYQYAFSFLRSPHIRGKTQYLNANQTMISVGLLYKFGTTKN